MKGRLHWILQIGTVEKKNVANPWPTWWSNSGTRLIFAFHSLFSGSLAFTILWTFPCADPLSHAASGRTFTECSPLSPSWYNILGSMIHWLPLLDVYPHTFTLTCCTRSDKTGNSNTAKSFTSSHYRACTCSGFFSETTSLRAITKRTPLTPSWHLNNFEKPFLTAYRGIARVSYLD